MCFAAFLQLLASAQACIQAEGGQVGLANARQERNDSVVGHAARCSEANALNEAATHTDSPRASSCNTQAVKASRYPHYVAKLHSGGTAHLHMVHCKIWYCTREGYAQKRAVKSNMGVGVFWFPQVRHTPSSTRTEDPHGGCVVRAARRTKRKRLDRH